MEASSAGIEEGHRQHQYKREQHEGGEHFDIVIEHDMNSHYS
jgi:hypothetical protein